MKQLHKLRLFLLAILTFALVCACRGDSPRQVSSQAANTSTKAVRVIKHAMGQTKVTVNPQRVVVLDSLDTVLSLGVQPIGTVQLFPDDDYLKNKAEEIKSVGSDENPSIESIAALKPDLILGGNFYNKQENYELLSQIAPTVIADIETSGDWQKLLNKYAEALGKTDEAKQILADYHARIEKFQAQMGDCLKETEVSLVNVYQDGIYIYLEDSFGGAIVADTGLSRPSDQVNANNLFSMTISKEQLYIADADAIFVWSPASSNSKEAIRKAQSRLQQLKADPLWSKLNAVQQNKLYAVPSYWLGMGPIAANLVLDDLFKYLVE